MEVWMTVIITLWLFCASIMDIRDYRVPVGMLIVGGGIAILVLAIRYCAGEMVWFDMLKGILPGGLLSVIALTTRKAGYGDGIVLLMLGLVVGGARSLMILGLSLLLVSAWSIILLALRKAGRTTEIPYVPFLAMAWLAVIKL